MLLLLAWGPAILLQLAHPLVAQGIADHSAVLKERRGRWRRFNHTVNAMLGLCFGTEEEARAILARINKIHDRVHGRLSQAVGIFPAGTPYSAHDPALLAWVHATLLDMNVRVYELYVAPLAAGEADRYCAEASAIEEPFGIPHGLLPRTGGALRRYLDGMLASGELAVGDVARELAMAVLHPPRPWVAEPALAFVRLVTAGLLPPAVRGEYGLSWEPRHEKVLRLSARLIRAALPFVPPVVRYWPAARRRASRVERRPISAPATQR